VEGHSGDSLAQCNANIYIQINSRAILANRRRRHSAARDFIYVQDIVNGLLFCATKGAQGDVYNLASGVETSILELATVINELTGNQASIDFRPGRDRDHSGRRFGSTEKSKRELWLEANVSI
jgi:UDP-glucose 4-epimerase